MSLENHTLLIGDIKDKIKEIPNGSIDLITTDPPYGYSFMNKDWDKEIISVDVWKECLRVLKAGSFAFVMSTPRQDVLSHMIVNLTDAGFVMGFTSMYWAYASGFPKAMNISKVVDKKLGFEREVTGKDQCFGSQDSEIYGFNTTGKNKTEFDKKDKPATPQAKRLDGSYAGFQPKPAVEVIIVCMKPLSEKNYVEQALSNQKGVTWFDDCRIPYTKTDNYDLEKRNVSKATGIKQDDSFLDQIHDKDAKHGITEKGRFPANLIVSDNSLDVGKKTKGHVGANGYFGFTTDKGWNKNDIPHYNPELGHTGTDEGDFSRYFSLDSWEAQFIITPKPSKSEKNKGLEQYLHKTDQYEGKYPNSQVIGKKVNDGRKKPVDNPFQRGETIRQNTHPTVKPVSLFKYLVTLGSRPDDIVLDPFMGSGTTAIACEQLARNWIGIEQNQEYSEIIDARLADYKKQIRIDTFA